MRFVGGLIVLFLLGCGSGGSSNPDTVNVSGTIYLDSKPLAGADVKFVSEVGQFLAYAKTGADGKYTLVQGAVPGKNKVVISKIEGGENLNIDPEEGMDEGQFEADALTNSNSGRAKANLPKELVPKEFSDPEKSKLTYEVPADGTESADFRL